MMKLSGMDKLTQNSQRPPAVPATVDVLVVGYGPVGAALAGFLGAYGVRVLIIDREADIFQGPRAIALDNEALRILQSLGVDQSFEKVIIPRVQMHSPFVGHFCTLKTDVLVDGHPKLVTFYQPQLDRALRSKAEQLPSVTALTSTPLVDFTDLSSGIRARLRTPDGLVHEVYAKYLVGADGAGSVVRQAIGQDFKGESYSEDWLIIDGQGLADNIDHIEFICNPKRPIPHMVAPGGRTRWEFMLQPGESREAIERDESIRQLLTPWPATAQMTIERKAVYRFQARSCDKYSKGRVFLCGDAAHVTPPFAGQGLVSGLRDTANLAWKLAWVIQKGADARILETYDEERRPHAISMIGLAKGMGAAIMPSSTFKALLIQGTLKLLRLIPPVRRFIEDFKPKPKNEYRSGLFVAGKSRLKRGGLLPQFPINAANGDSVLSDDLLGNSPSVIGFGVDPASILDDATRSAWVSLGGAFATFPLAALPADLPRDWCAVIRPDRTVMHDGAARDACVMVRQALALLGGSSR